MNVDTSLRAGGDGRNARPRTARPTYRPAAVFVLLALLVVLAAGALYGGAALVADPSGALLDMPVTLLDGSPFTDYLVPGSVLFVLLGLFPLATAGALWLRPAALHLRRIGVHAAWLGALGVGLTLIVWILVQMTILRFHLQPPFLVLGVAIVVVTSLPSVRKYCNASPPERAEGRSREKVP